MMTTTIYALLPPPDDGGRWQQLVAAHASAVERDEREADVLDEAEEYFEEVGWPGPAGDRELPIKSVQIEQDGRAAAENYIVHLDDIPEGTVSLRISNSW